MRPEAEARVITNRSLAVLNDLRHDKFSWAEMPWRPRAASRPPLDIPPQLPFRPSASHVQWSLPRQTGRNVDTP